MLARGGYKWITGSLLLSALILLLNLITSNIILLVISVIFLICVCFFMIFFRDPNRRPGFGIVAPADGRIISITHSNSKTNYRIATFMSVTNVHVNRAPLDAMVLSMVHKPGKFKPAYQAEAKQNERLITTLKTRIGKIKVIQIAGILAQRIVPYIQPKQNLKKGQRIGIIQFGSRVDLLLPRLRVKVLVNVGDCVHAGTTTVARIINYKSLRGARK